MEQGTVVALLLGGSAFRRVSFSVGKFESEWVKLHGASKPEFAEELPL